MLASVRVAIWRGLARLYAGRALTRAFHALVVLSLLLPSSLAFAPTAYAFPAQSAQTVKPPSNRPPSEKVAAHPLKALQGSSNPDLDAFRPLPSFGSYVLAACRPADELKGKNTNTLKLGGQAHTYARGFGSADEQFGGSIRSNADIDLSGQANVNGDAVPGSGFSVQTKGKAEVAGSTDPAEDAIDCRQEDLGSLIAWIEANHENDLIGESDQGQLPWGKSKDSDPFPFELGKGEVFHLPAGVFWFSSWKQGPDSQVVVDGYTRILLTGSFDLSDGAQVNADESPYNLLVFHLPQGSQSTKWHVQSKAVLNGLFYAPDLDASLAGDVHLEGGLLADQIDAEGSAQAVLWADSTSPEVRFTQPEHTTLNVTTLSVNAKASDDGAGLDPQGFHLLLDGDPVEFTASGDDTWSQATIEADLTDLSEGLHTLTVKVIDRAGNSAKAELDLLIDLTPPTITARPSPAPNDAGWNNTDVTVTFECNDPGDYASGIASCSDPVTLTQEGSGQVVKGQVEDNAGNNASTSATIWIDKTPPDLTYSIDPPPNAAEWNNSEVTATFSAEDTLSGLKSLNPQTASVDDDGKAQVVEATAVDVADNTTTAQATVNLDTTPPEISGLTPSDGSTVENARPELSAQFSDSLSGVDPQTATVLLDGVDLTSVALPSEAGFAFTPDTEFEPGLHTLQVDVSDVAGNPAATASSTFTVEGAAPTPTPSPTPPPSPLSDASLSLSPPNAGPNVVGSDQTLTATLLDQLGMPVAGYEITFDIAGPNATSGTATTASDGTAAFTYTGGANGTDSALASTSDGVITLDSNISQVSWVTPVQEIATTSIWGRFFRSDNSGVFKTTPNDTPVFDLPFPTINFNPPAGTVPGNTSGINVYSRPFTDVTTDLNGEFTGTITAQGNGFQAGSGPLGSFAAVFTGQYVVATPGDVVFNFFSDDGFIFSVGGGATRVSGPLVNAPASGVSAFEGFPVMGSYNQGTAPVANTITVNFPEAGTYPYEVDYTECCGFQLVLTMTTATASGNLGVPPSGSILISPSTTTNRTVGESQPFTVTVTDASGNPLSDLPVSLSVSGPNNSYLESTTDSAGQATFTYTGYYQGADSVQAISWVSGVASYSSKVRVNWAAGPPPPANAPLAVPGWIKSPSNQTVITQPTAIALANNKDLTGGTFDFWPVADPSDVTVISTNLHTYGGRDLGVFDPTTLPNGSYIIRLSATDLYGQSQQSGILVTVAGDYKPGRVRFSLVDFTVPVSGIPITIGRAYDSLERSTTGDFGHGWSLAIGHPDLQVNPAKDVTLTMPGGQRVTFFFTPKSAPGVFGFLLLPQYTAEAGVYGNLTSDGCSLVVPSGGTYFCFPGSEYQPSAYTYTDPYGRQYRLGADGSLRSIQDLSGNKLTFSADGITSSAGGLNVPFVRDSQGRITRITDPEGHVYSYGYDSNGDLISVSLPGVSQPLSYTYDSDHFFLSATDPRGNPIITDTYDPDGRLESETDALGNVYHYAYDISNRKTTVTYPDGGTVVSAHDSFGMLLSRKDPLGQTTSFTYDANHNLLTRYDPLGHTIHYAYDSQGNRTSVTNALGQASSATFNPYGGPLTKTDAAGSTLNVGYDSRYRPTSMSDSLGTLAGFTWDSHGNSLTRSDGEGQVTHYAYDPYGHMISDTDPLGRKTTYGYDLLGRQTSVSDPMGHTTTFDYDPLGRLVTITEPLGKVTHYEYDGNGNRTAVVDPLGNRTTYTYDAGNNLIEVDYPDGTSERTTYDWRGSPLTHTDQAGHLTRYDYDLAGQLTSVTYAAGTADPGTVHYGYDDAGRKTSLTDELGHTTHYIYDAADRLIEADDPMGKATHYTHDPDGRRTSTTDPNSHTTQFAYNARGWLTRTTYADSTMSNQSYDGNGRVLTRTDQADKTTHFGYDDAGQLVSVTDPLGLSTSYGYDAAGNLTSITDPNGHTTSFAYDALNRQTSKTWPDTSFESYGYDLNGNLLSHRLADGQTNSFAYDVLDRQVRTDYFDGSTVQTSYTPNGLRQTVIDGRGTTSYSYDARDRLTSITQPDGRQVGYGHDAAGNRTSMTTPAGTVHYTYDADNRLLSVTDPNGAASTYTYDPAGMRTGLSLPNGVDVAYAYDSLNRLTGLTQSLGGTTLASYAYTLDPSGHRLGVSEADGSSIAWTYDNAYRLLSETMTDPASVVTYQADFSYDPAGNRLSQTVDGTTTNYTYNDLDQLQTAGSATFGYNGRGDLIQMSDGGDVTTYSWDGGDRLTGVSLPGGTTVANTYDAGGRRVAQTVGSQITDYLWDEASPFGDVVYETAGASTTSYVLGGTELLSQTRDGVTSYYLNDGQTSIRDLTDASGTITDTYHYSAYGELLSQTGSTANTYLYTGQQFDAATGLYSLRSRYYASEVGRFLSRDSVDHSPSDPNGLNRYLYAGDNPIDEVDPTGRQGLNEYSQANEPAEQEEPAAAEVGSSAADATGLANAAVERIEAGSLWQEYIPRIRIRGFSGRPPVTVAQAAYAGSNGPEYVVATNNTYGVIGEDLASAIQEGLGDAVQARGETFVGGVFEETATQATSTHAEINMLNYFKDVADTLPANTRVSIGVSHPAGICGDCLELLAKEGATELGDGWIVEIGNGVRLIFLGY